MIALLKLSPIAVLAGMMIGGIDILLSAPIAFVCAVLVAMVTDHYSFGELQDAALWRSASCPPGWRPPSSTWRSPWG